MRANDDEPAGKDGVLPARFRSPDEELDGQTRVFGGLDDIFPGAKSPRWHGTRRARSHNRLVWKTRALCATVRPK
jgi:hypothetical protein